MPISNLDLHAARRINYIGVTFSTRSIEEIREILPKSAATFGRRWKPAKPIDQMFAFDDIGKAFERMEDRGDAVVFSACPGRGGRCIAWGFTLAICARTQPALRWVS